MITKLSVIERSSPLGVQQLVIELERAGYHRFWTTEHHSPDHSASPTVLTAVAASVTSRLRVGTGGVMLRLQSAMRVAEDFHLLEALFPKRIDLGVISGRPSRPAVELALATGSVDQPPFPERLRELCRLLRADPSAVTPVGVPSIRAETAPELWVCGLSMDAARLAAEVGAGFAYSLTQHVAGAHSTASVIQYRETFRSRVGEDARVLVACHGICAETEQEAKISWRPYLPDAPVFLGCPAQCREQLECVAEQYGTSELAVQCLGESFECRLESYRLLAQSLGLDVRSSCISSLSAHSRDW